MHPHYLDAVYALAINHEVALLHPRGTGESPRPASPDAYAVEDYADDLVAWIQRAADGPVHLLGHSHGGIVATRVAATRPDLVRTLVLLSTPAYGGARAESEAHALHVTRADEPACAAALAALAAQSEDNPAEADLGRFIAEIIPLWVAPITERARRWQTRLAAQPANRDALQYFDERVFGDLDRVAADLAAVGCPVLALTGDLDGWAGPDHLALLGNWAAEARTAIIVGAGHMCHVDAMDRITELVTTFVLENERSRA
jgi:pimeloyl-ACP methyl ester carboxylesterase